jgi:hypothetical protein
MMFGTRLSRLFRQKGRACSDAKSSFASSSLSNVGDTILGVSISSAYLSTIIIGTVFAFEYE